MTVSFILLRSCLFNLSDFLTEKFEITKKIADSTVVRVFAFRTGDRGSIPCRVIPKTIKMVIVPLCQAFDKREGTISSGVV